ncbi:MAG: AraC family transcriptional regulator [Hyphomicrobiales bacterium]
MKSIEAPTELITPSQRMHAVPVSCTGHSDLFGWDGIRVEDYRDLPESDLRLPGMDHHLLVYHYKALTGEFTHECAGRKTLTHLRSGQLSFIPAGADNRWAFGQGKPSALHIMVRTDCFDNVLTSDQMTLRDNFQVTSSALEDIARRLQFELDQNGASGVLFAETMTAMLSETISKEFGEHTSKNSENRCNVSLARELIEAEYDRSIHLDELASLSNLSQSQVIRAFTTQFGTSPHQYLLACRLNKAKRRLLSGGDETLAQLAVDLGFSDQSHFTRLFRRATGVTPNQFLARQ